MAIFGKKKNTAADTEKRDDQERAKDASSSEHIRFAKDILIRPRVTEKAMLETQNGVYVFDVREGVNKTEIKDEIKRVYKVTPRKVATVRVPKKRTFQRGIRGIKGGGKKAYVYLKEGDKIDLM